MTTTFYCITLNTLQTIIFIIYVQLSRIPMTHKMCLLINHSYAREEKDVENNITLKF